MKKISKYIFSFVFGIGIGNLIELVISMFVGQLIIGVPEFVNSQSTTLVAKIIETILYGGFGLVSTFFGERFTYENLTKNSIIHFLTIAIYFSVVGLYLRWFVSISSLLLSLISFAIVYAIIWVIIYMVEKNNIDMINEKLDKRNKKN